LEPKTVRFQTALEAASKFSRHLEALRTPPGKKRWNLFQPHSKMLEADAEGKPGRGFRARSDFHPGSKRSGRDSGKPGEKFSTVWNRATLPVSILEAISRWWLEALLALRQIRAAMRVE